MHEDPCIAVQELLTEEERKRFLDRVFEHNPHLRGAHVADLLDMMCDLDVCLELVEPATSMLKDKVARPDLIQPAALAVVYIHSSPAGIQEANPPMMVGLIGEVRELVSRTAH